VVAGAADLRSLVAVGSFPSRPKSNGAHQYSEEVEEAELEVEVALHSWIPTGGGRGHPSDEAADRDELHDIADPEHQRTLELTETNNEGTGGEMGATRRGWFEVELFTF